MDTRDVVGVSAKGDLYGARTRLQLLYTAMLLSATPTLHAHTIYEGLTSPPQRGYLLPLGIYLSGRVELVVSLIEVTNLAAQDLRSEWRLALGA